MINLISLIVAASLMKQPGKVEKSMEFHNPMVYGATILDNEGKYRIIDPEDLQLMCRVVMSEAGNQSVKTQEAVATVIINRWLNPEKYPDTIEEVINEPKQFSTAYNGEVTLSVMVATNNAITYYNTFAQDLPKQCYYFRSGKYHNFGIPYCSMDDLYFSLAEDAVVD